MTQEVQNQIKHLRVEIDKHNQLYYQDNTPQISDYQYDQLLQKLKQLENKYPEYDDINSPTQNVGGKPTEQFKNFTHKVPMLSLDNSNNEKEFLEFDKRVKKLLNLKKSPEYSCELKIDGVALSLHYQGLKLVNAVTRGDGITGENVFHNIRQIQSLNNLTCLPCNGLKDFEIRGELYMSKKTFSIINQNLNNKEKKVFANARNATSGTLRQLDKEIFKSRNLEFIAYSLYNHSVNLFEDSIFSTQSQVLSYIAKTGIAHSPFLKIFQNIEQAIKHYNHILNIREDLPFEIDGLVFKVNSLELQKKLGVASKYPKWATAFKFPSGSGYTTIKAIQFQVGKTGVITPVALLEPIELNGVTISHASLHNFDEIQRLDIGIFDRVEIKRAGDVIPKITQLVEKNKDSINILPPHHCPSCNTELIKKEVGIFCPNITQCNQRILEYLKYYCSKEAMNIEFLGDTHIENLNQVGLLKTPADLYQFTSEDLITLPRMGETLAKKILENIDKSRQNEFYRFICALSIKNVGINKSKLLAKHYENIEQLAKVGKEELIRINDFGETIAQNIVEFFANEQNIQLLLDFKNKAKLQLTNQLFNQQQNIVNNFFSDQSFVITGTFKDYSREQLKEIIEQKGGKINNSISSKTSYLLVGKNPGSKLNKAKDLKIRILFELELKNRV